MQSQGSNYPGQQASGLVNCYLHTPQVSCQQPCSIHNLDDMVPFGKFTVLEKTDWTLAEPITSLLHITISSSPVLRLPSKTCCLWLRCLSVLTPVVSCLEFCRGKMANQASDTPLRQTTLRS